MQRRYIAQTMGECRACILADAATRSSDASGSGYTRFLPFTIDDVQYKVVIRKIGNVKTLFPVTVLSIHYIGRVYTRGSTWWAKPLQNDTDYSYEADSTWDPSVQLGAWNFRRKIIEINGSKANITTLDTTDPPINCRYTFGDVSISCHQGVDYPYLSGTHRWRLGHWNTARINQYNAPYAYYNGVPITVGGLISDISPTSLLACGVVTLSNSPAEGPNEAPPGPNKTLELIYTAQNVVARQEAVSLTSFNSVMRAYKSTVNDGNRETNKYYNYRNLPELTATRQYDISTYDFHTTGLYPIFQSHVGNTSEFYGFGTTTKPLPHVYPEGESTNHRYISSSDKLDSEVTTPPKITDALLFGVNSSGAREYLTYDGNTGTLKNSSGQEVFSRPKVEGGSVIINVVLAQHETRTYVAYATVDTPNGFPVFKSVITGFCTAVYTLFYRITLNGTQIEYEETFPTQAALDDREAEVIVMPGYSGHNDTLTYTGTESSSSVFHSFKRELYLCVRSGDAVSYELLSECKGIDGFGSSSRSCAEPRPAPTESYTPQKDPGVYSYVGPVSVGPYSSTFVAAPGAPVDKGAFDHAAWYTAYQEDTGQYKSDSIVAQPQCACSKDGERIIVQQFFFGVSADPDRVTPTANVKSFSRLYVASAGSLQYYDINTPREQIYGLKKADGTNAQGGVDDGAEVDEIMRSIYVP